MSFRSERYRRRCQEVLRDEEIDHTDVASSLSFEDCFEMCAGSDPTSPATVSSSSGSSRSTSPGTADEEEEARNRQKKGPRSPATKAASKACSRVPDPPQTLAQKHSPSSILELPSSQLDADTSAMSLGELLAFQTTRARSRQTEDFTDCGLTAESVDNTSELDFSMFGGYESPVKSSVNLLPLVAGVMRDPCVGPQMAAENLLRGLSLAVAEKDLGLCNGDLNTVTMNRLVPRLVDLKCFSAAREVLEIMTQLEMTFTTQHDEWFARGRLTPAVAVLRDIVRNQCCPSQDTLENIFFSWIQLSSKGVRCARDVCAIMCQQDTVIKPEFSRRLVETLLGKPASCYRAVAADGDAPVHADCQKSKLVLMELVLKDILRSPKVHFEFGALAALLHSLEEGSSGSSELAIARQRFIEQIRRRVCKRAGAQCIRCIGVFLRSFLRQGKFGPAKKLLLTLNVPSVGNVVVDSMFLTSTLHELAAVVGSSPMVADRNSKALLDTARTFCRVVAENQAIKISYSVLNQALNTLRMVGEPVSGEQSSFSIAALLAVALFDGLRGLHAKSVNRRTFDRLFDLLLRTDVSSHSMLSALKRVSSEAVAFGYNPSSNVQQQLVAAGVNEFSSRMDRTSSEPIDIETLIPRSSSSEKLSSLGGDLPRGANPRTRIAFENCN